MPRSLFAAPAVGPAGETAFPRRLSALCALAAQGLVVAGPTALAFFSGGYFAQARTWAGVGTGAALLLGAVAGIRSGNGAAAVETPAASVAGALARNREAAIAIAGLALLAAWTLLSIVWAPIAGDAYAAGQIAVLYAAGLLAASVALGNGAARWAELGLAAGTVVVIGYGLAGRLLPGILHYAASGQAEGRLDQPLTYWNATGELAAIGLVLVAHIAGDRRRSRAVATAAAAAAVPLAVGLYASVSRGALFAVFAGLVALVVLAPRREQLWAIVCAVGIGAATNAVLIPLDGFTSLSGTLSDREAQGVIAFVVLAVAIAIAATMHQLMTRRTRPGPLLLPRGSGWIAVALIAAGLAFAVAVGARESDGTVQLNGSSSRLTSLRSDRFDYWSVALRAFDTQPVRGVGAGNWQVYWLHWRRHDEFAQDAHSLPLQTLAELGIVGEALLLMFVLGLVLAARRALPGHPEVAGAVAALVTYFAHAPLDWDWQMPAVTLVAIALAGIVLASARAPTTAPRRSAAPPA